MYDTWFATMIAFRSQPSHAFSLHVKSTGWSEMANLVRVVKESGISTDWSSHGENLQALGGRNEWMYETA